MTGAATRLPPWLDEGLVFAKGAYRLREGTFAGGPIHPDRVSRVFDARIHKHGLKDIRLHDLRHTWAAGSQDRGQ